MAVLGICCCSGFFFSRSEQGLLSCCGVQASLCGCFPCCITQAQGGVGFSSCSMGAQKSWL